MNYNLHQWYVDHLFEVITSRELISNISSFRRKYEEVLEDDLYFKLKDIERINLKTFEDKKVSSQLNDIIKMNEAEFKKHRELYYQHTLRSACIKMIQNQYTPFQLNQLLSNCELEFDYPEWTGDLYNKFYHVNENTTMDFDLKQAAQKAISELSSILKS